MLPSRIDPEGTPIRSRGFSPPAAVAILVGVTAASVAGFLALAPLLVPQAGPGPSTCPTRAPERQAPEVLPAAGASGTAPLAVVAEPEPAPDSEASSRPETAPARGRPRPAPTAPEGRGRTDGASGRAEAPPPARDGFGGDLDDPLANIDFGEIEG